MENSAPPAPTAPGRLDELLDQLRPDWMRDGLCREHAHLNWVPANPKTEANAREQLQVCGRCLVRSECLDHALADPELLGIWGGTDTSARRAIRVARRIEMIPAESLEPTVEPDQNAEHGRPHASGDGQGNGGSEDGDGQDDAQNPALTGRDVVHRPLPPRVGTR